MGFRTIDLDTKEGMEKYKKLKETKSIQETFGNEGIEKFAPRPEEEPKQEEAITLEVNIQAPAVLQGVVTGVDQLRVRKQPEGDILYLISKDSIVKILEDHDGWLKVETAPGRQGFVMKSYIKVYSEGG
jgi:hypothetical protein